MDSHGQLTPFLQVDLSHYHQKQTLPQVWSSNSSIFVLGRVLSCEETDLQGANLGYVMPRSEALDIDTPWDFRLAELTIADLRLSASTV